MVIVALPLRFELLKNFALVRVRIHVQCDGVERVRFLSEPDSLIEAGAVPVWIVGFKRGVLPISFEGSGELFDDGSIYDLR